MSVGFTGREKFPDLMDSAFLAYNSARLREGVELFTRKMLEPDVTVGMSFAGALQNYPDLMERVGAVPGVTRVAPFVHGQVMISSGENVAGILVRGVLPVPGGAEELQAHLGDSLAAETAASTPRHDPPTPSACTRCGSAVPATSAPIMNPSALPSPCRYQLLAIFIPTG